MNRGRVRLFVGAAVVILVLVAGSVAVAASNRGGQSELAPVKAAVAKYHRTSAAEAAGWVLVPGLDHCFDNPGVGAMGIHYINTGLLDTELDVEQPEALVYQHKPNGELSLGAVEWIVPAEAWEAAGQNGPPQLLDMPLHLNEALGVYVLHAWVFEKNPAGTYEDWNPDVSCPQ